MEVAVCKGCTGTVRLTREEIDEIFGETMKVKNVKLVTEEEYNNRLEKCRSCDHLEYGTTCKFCGLYNPDKSQACGRQMSVSIRAPLVGMEHSIKTALTGLVRAVFHIYVVYSGFVTLDFYNA